jgi:hypothetical protein
MCYAVLLWSESRYVAPLHLQLHLGHWQVRLWRLAQVPQLAAQHVRLNQAGQVRGLR